MADVRKRVIVYGYVQGVGFRYFAKMNAQRFNIKGYVENLYDGTVLLEAEGSDDAVDAYLKAVAQGNRYIDVERMETKNIPLEHDREFYIR